jgi:Glycosyl transferases group 1
MTSPGVNVVGYFNHLLGIGESARLFARALRAAGVEHTLAAIEPVGAAKPLVTEPTVPWLDDRPLPHGVTVLWCNPRPLRERRRALAVPGMRRRALGVGPRHAARVVACVRRSRRRDLGALTLRRRRGGGRDRTPVRVMSPAIPVLDTPPLTRAAWGLPDGVPLFLFVFDHASTIARKNPLGLIEAFGRAFNETRDAALLVKGLNALLAGCDCYVSLHRSEGFGLTLAEALSHARPLVATDFGGSLDFTDATTASLVRATRTPVGDGVPIYPEGATWAEPDLDHAAELMRGVVDAPDEARARGERGREHIRAVHSPEAVGEAARDAVARLAA